ncbi:MAG: OmpA family protein [Desulfosalsimonadaceae bacterium]
MKKYACYQLVFILFCTAAVSVNAHAGEVNFGDKPPSINEVVQALKPDAQPDMKLRGINYHAAPPAPKMVSITLEFEKNSAQLTPKTEQNLSMIGKALSSTELKQLTFTLEGHADASGTAEHNLSLSQKRAAAVKNYLVENHHIDSASLNVVGKGESDLLDQNNPESPQNRRVRIVTNQ